MRRQVHPDLSADVGDRLAGCVGRGPCPGRRPTKGVIRAAGKRSRRRRHSQIMGEIIEPVAAVGEPALIIIRGGGGLSSSTGKIVIAHVGKAVAERDDPRDPIGLGSSASKRDRPHRQHGHPCCFRRECSQHHRFTDSLRERLIMAGLTHCRFLLRSHQMRVSSRPDSNFRGILKKSCRDVERRGSPCLPGGPGVGRRDAERGTFETLTPCLSPNCDGLFPVSLGATVRIRRPSHLVIRVASSARPTNQDGPRTADYSNAPRFSKRPSDSEV